MRGICKIAPWPNLPREVVLGEFHQDQVGELAQRRDVYTCIPTVVLLLVSQSTQSSKCRRLS